MKILEIKYTYTTERLDTQGNIVTSQTKKTTLARKRIDHEVHWQGHQFRDWNKVWFYNKPYGRLIMQDIDGNHINKPVIGVEEPIRVKRDT